MTVTSGVLYQAGVTNHRLMSAEYCVVSSTVSWLLVQWQAITD